jgi:phosphoglycolate phosphatase
MRLFVFDCDGTLVDSQARIVQSMRRAAEKTRLEPPDRDAVRALVGLRLEEAAVRLYPDANEDEHRILVEHYREAFHDFSAAEGPEPLFDGCREALERLNGAEELLAVATGKSRRGLERVLLGHGLLERFSALATADDGPGKPNPTILIELMDRCGVSPPECVMIGDTSFDMEMAVNAGARRLGVSWGYHAGDVLVQSGAEGIVDSFSELPEVARNLLK